MKRAVHDKYFIAGKSHKYLLVVLLLLLIEIELWGESKKLDNIESTFL